jgi:uncharacterized protein
MIEGPQLLPATVAHTRLAPRRNSFAYRVYYGVFALSDMGALPRHWGLGWRARDHGPGDGSALEPWARGILAASGLGDVAGGPIVLVAMPRVMGYVFNPVSFWLCLGHDDTMRAVLCEVHNTFGEKHTYVCAHPDGRPIGPGDWLESDKDFFVSPFIKRNGSYRYRFSFTQKGLGVWINYLDEDSRIMLTTSMVGRLQPMTRASLARAFWGQPLVTLKAIGLIHWQAVKLLAKGVRYLIKPPQHAARITPTRGLVLRSGRVR